MKKIILILLILKSINSFACSCDLPHPALEFYSSKYVFEGVVSLKEYAKDSLTYKITFDVIKHYKNGDKPKRMVFTLSAEEKYTGVWTSCDWSACEYQKWLVYAHYYKGKLTFAYYCSNSRPIDNVRISEREQKILDNGNDLVLEEYIYNNEYSFNHTKPISDINSIFKKGKIKNYNRPFTWLEVYINKKGKLKSVYRVRDLITVKDKIFDLDKNIKIKLRKPLTEFEKDAIKLVKKIKKWETKKHKKTNIPVSYRKHISVEYDNEKKLWKYEF